MTNPRKAPKPVRLWALVNRMGRTPYIVWSVASFLRRDVERNYLYWLCGVESPRAEDERAQFRKDLAAGRYTIERVTVTTGDA